MVVALEPAVASDLEEQLLLPSSRSQTHCGGGGGGADVCAWTEQGLPAHSPQEGNAGVCRPLSRCLHGKRALNCHSLCRCLFWEGPQVV